MMVMKEGKKKFCPYCFSENLKVIDHGLAKKEYCHHGKFWFMYECQEEDCKGKCECITKL